MVGQGFLLDRSLGIEEFRHRGLNVGAESSLGVLIGLRRFRSNLFGYLIGVVLVKRLEFLKRDMNVREPHAFPDFLGLLLGHVWVIGRQLTCLGGIESLEEVIPLPSG